MKGHRGGIHEPGIRQAGAPDAAPGASTALVQQLVSDLAQVKTDLLAASSNAVSAFNSAIAANDAAQTAFNEGQAGFNLAVQVRDDLAEAETALSATTATANDAAAAAAAAQATADAAAAAAAAAAVVPLSLDEHFRARFRSISPAGRPSFMYDELERCFSAGGEVAGWIANGAATCTDERGSSVKCVGGGPSTNNAIHRYGSAALGNQRSKRWHMGGAAEFVGPVGAGSGEWRAFMLINAPGNLPDYMIGMGLFADVSETKFSWRTVGDNGIVSALSTIDYAPGRHIFEMWTITDHSNGNVVEMWGSVDEETPILIGNLRNNMPDGPLYQWHGVINGTDTMYLDAICVQSER